MRHGSSNWQFVLPPISGLPILVAAIMVMLPTGPGARAQTYTVLHSFCTQRECIDGDHPTGPLIQATDGNFYGTTYFGGVGNGGSIFTISPGGFTTISICKPASCPQGAEPLGLMQASNENIYGTSYDGPSIASGAEIFVLTPSGALETLIDGFYQTNQLVQAINSDLYGTTSVGGTGSPPDGTVFKTSTTGVVTTLYSFCTQLNCTDGSYPNSPLVQASNGDFYGTTQAGGIVLSGISYGTIFKITPSATFTTLYRFCKDGGQSGACTDGAYPNTLLQATDGSLYGTTVSGGECASHECGTVFMLNVGLGPFVALQTRSGDIGAKVNILGTSLNGATSVTFNGTPATFTVNSTGTAIVAIAPAGATTGSVQVATPNGTLKSDVVYTVN